jgi:predicted AlkP superfamily pyrophosphatase or phosphodiesterase
MKKYFILILFFLPIIASAQKGKKTVKIEERPKLVVGLVIDQMRWDYLYRFADRYEKGGFKRLLSEGFSCENTYIPYLPSFTACGHSSIYTGSVPAINGITGNDWVDQVSGYSMYCTEDTTVNTVGSTSNAGKMSPKNLLTSTISDELRLATNFRSKVIGVSIKDRGGILPAGHTANAAYWFDDISGNWITSTHYMQKLPSWVSSFNDQKLPDYYLQQDWNTLYPIDTYVQSNPDDNSYEGAFKNEKRPVFPHQLATVKGADYGILRSTPYGNTLTLDFAKKAIEEEELGKDNITDILAVSLSSTDYIGHQFGPNSIEIEDTYLRLDRDIASFLNYLDLKIGKGKYTFFVTADHAGAHNPNYLIDKKIPAGFWDGKQAKRELDTFINHKYKVKGLVRSLSNYHVNFNYTLINQHNINLEELKKDCIAILKAQPGTSYIIDITKVNESTIPNYIKEKIVNGYNPKRTGELQIILEPGWFQGYSLTGTTHGTWNPYDTHIPLVFMGWGINKGSSNKHVYMTDIAPTLAALLHIQEPNGSIGAPITEVISLKK